MSDSTKLTSAERQRLEQAIAQIDRGDLSATWPLVFGGFGRASLSRTCDRLCSKGLLKPYVHGGWEVTDAGRRVALGDP